MYHPPTKKVNLDDIMAVLPGRYAKYDTYVGTLCPFHDDSSPSLLIHADGYKCLACGARGSVEALINFYKSGKLKVKIQKKENRFENPFWKWEQDGLESSFIKNWKRLQAFPNNASYLINRGITLQTINQLRIGFSDGWFSIPVFDCLNNFIGGIARAGLEIKKDVGYILSKGIKGLYVPSFSKIKKSNILYVTFGILDAVSLYQLGFAAASTLYGKNANPDYFNDFRIKTVFIPDLQEEAEGSLSAAKLGWRGKMLAFPYGDFGDSKDINDCLQYDAQKLRSYLQ